MSENYTKNDIIYHVKRAINVFLKTISKKYKKGIKKFEEPIKTVPYQICPKCQGHKEVSNFGCGCSAIDKIPCDICNGKGIIPEYMINE